ncbi:serine/threonine-protein kinase [Kribbella antiqua]|uniref:serine/threonine-protein kinase n=1 Tax=Kribbella antiqua TaxID=2512217 RepID=UPI0024116039|nr:serine/threonine-protein kinase [Kribbella antiqua]
MEAFAGRYRLIDLIGTGGMGSVWRAWDLRRSAYVAAKVLGQHDAATLLRFVREQSLRIEHPHVVAPHGWAADDDKVVFAMDLVRGGSVATLLGDHGPLPPSYVAVLLDQLLHGLSAVHAAGVVHRDLKPANLLLDVTGTGRPHLRLSDFGVAGLLDEPRMTRHSTVLGTPGYIAPEQLAGADPDPRQDLYTVGAVAAELLTGERPGADGKLPHVDGPLADFIHRSTATDPSHRPESAHTAARLLAASGALPPPGTTPWTTTPDTPEVFDQLPPLPPPWTPTGPTTQPPPTPRTPSPATPAPGTTSPATPTPAAPAPSTTAPATPSPAAAGPAAPGPAAPRPAASGGERHEREAAGGGRSSQHPRAATTAPNDLQTITSSPPASRQHSATTADQPALGPNRRRLLVWVATVSLTGAIALLGTATWLLLT